MQTAIYARAYHIYRIYRAVLSAFFGGNWALRGKEE